MTRRVWLAIGVLILVLGAAFGVWTMAQGDPQAITGRVASSHTRSDGREVCVKGSGQLVCGTTSMKRQSGIEPVDLGDCALIEANRGLLVRLQRRSC